MTRLLIAQVVLIVGGVTGLYFERYLHIKEPVVYFLLGIVTIGLYVVILYKTIVR